MKKWALGFTKIIIILFLHLNIWKYKKLKISGPSEDTISKNTTSDIRIQQLWVLILRLIFWWQLFPPTQLLLFWSRSTLTYLLWLLYPPLVMRSYTCIIDNIWWAFFANSVAVVLIAVMYGGSKLQFHYAQKHFVLLEMLKCQTFFRHHWNKKAFHNNVTCFLFFFPAFMITLLTHFIQPFKKYIFFRMACTKCKE